jgi:hypothetical protein
VNSCGEGDFSEAFDVIVDICGSVEENRDHPFSIMPNPSSGQFIIDFRGEMNGEYRIGMVDLLGNAVMAEKRLNTTGIKSVSMDVQHLESGIYFLVIRNGVSVWKEKVILQVQ